MSTNERDRLTIKRARSGCAQQPRALQQKSAIISHQYFSGNKYSQYPTKTFGFSVAGKWPTPFIAWCLPPVIFSQVAWPISGVLLQSYSPVSMYTGHFLVSMLDMRLRPSHPPAKKCQPGSFLTCHVLHDRRYGKLASRVVSRHTAQVSANCSLSTNWHRIPYPKYMSKSPWKMPYACAEYRCQMSCRFASGAVGDII
jgi:hypothetical protein